MTPTLSIQPLDSEARPVGEAYSCTWPDFCEVNADAFSEGEFEAIAASLLRGETVRFGGGSAAAFAVTRIRPKTVAPFKSPSDSSWSAAKRA